MHKNLIKNNNHENWTEVAKRWQNNRLRILNILGGAKEGGAENFFERISLSLAKNKNVDQEIIIRKVKKDSKDLK